MSGQGRLAKAAGIITLLLVLSKLLGFIRESALAAVFGATRVTDAYLVGQTIPALAFSAIGSALGTTFIPVYTQIRQERGRDAAFDMANSVINATALLSLGFIVIGELFAQPLARLVAPGFRGTVLGLTVSLSRIMFPMVLFQALAGLLTGMLQTEGNFTVPAMVGLGFNVVIIATTAGLGPGLGIDAVAFGTVVAVATQVFFQMPALAKMGFRWRPILNLSDPGLRRVGQLVGPVLIGASVSQIGIIVDRMLASGLSSGSVSALNYASRLQALVPTVVGTAIVTVIYPTLSELSASGQWDKFSKTFATTVGLIIFALTPVAVGIAVMRVPLVRLAFQRGAFDATATESTAWALLFFSIGVVAFTVRDMIARAFYAFQDTTAPMVVGAIAVGINIILNLILVGPLKHGGLALATSLAAGLGAVAMLWILKDRVRQVSGGSVAGIGVRAILDSLWRVALASGLMGGVVWYVYDKLTVIVPGLGLTHDAVALFGSVGTGVVAYVVFALLFRVREAYLTLRIASSMVKQVQSRVYSRPAQTP